MRVGTVVDSSHLSCFCENACNKSRHVPAPKTPSLIVPSLRAHLKTSCALNARLVKHHVAPRLTAFHVQTPRPIPKLPALSPKRSSSSATPTPRLLLAVVLWLSLLSLGPATPPTPPSFAAHAAIPAAAPGLVAILSRAGPGCCISARLALDPRRRERRACSSARTRWRKFSFSALTISSSERCAAVSA